MIFRRTKSVVGLDIGSSAVKAVELRQVSSGYKVVAIGSEPVPADCIVDGAIIDGGAVADVIRQLFERNGIKTKEVVASLSGNAVIVKKIALPLMSDEELRESIYWEAEQYIPFDIQDVNLDYQVLQAGSEDQERGTMDVLLVAAKKEKIADYTGVTVSHGYDLAAAYRVTLTVTDDRGAVGSTSTTVTVANSRPSVLFVFSPSTPAVDTPVFFDASASQPTVPGRTLVSYAWVFGDGATGSGPTTSHTYSSASTYRVTLTVTDNLGEKNTPNATVPVGAVVVSASFTATITPLVGDRVVNFDASASTGSGLSYTWNFGDGAIVTETVPTITYAFVDDSTRNVVLTVTDIAGNTASTTVTVDPEP